MSTTTKKATKQATKPLYAAIGAGSTAIEKARELPQRVTTLPGQLKSINVLPDFFRPGSMALSAVTVNGRRQEYAGQTGFQVALDPNNAGGQVIVEFQPVAPGAAQESASSGTGKTGS